QAAYSWTLWEYLWEAGEPGDYTLLARAVSAGGKVQPTGHDPLCGGYLIYHTRPGAVRRRGARRRADQPGAPPAPRHDGNGHAQETSRLRLDVEMILFGGEGI